MVAATNKLADPAAPGSVLRRSQSYCWLWLLALTVFVLDQWSKAWIVSRLALNTYRPPEAITVIPNFFYVIHVGNTGAAWSLFAGRSTVLAVFAVVTLVAIYRWRRMLGLRQRVVQVSFGLLCGGIAGNLVDRLRHADGHVTDFLDFHFGSYIYPTFNIADSGICVGVVLYLIWSLRQPPEPKPGG